jgi:hypothetical protein
MFGPVSVEKLAADDVDEAGAHAELTGQQA